VLARTVVTGPLAPYAAGWRAELAARGFAPHSITAHAQLTAQLSGWLADTNQGLDALSDEVVEEYLRARGAAGYRSRTTVRAMAPLLGYLRGLRIVPQSVAALPVTPIEVLTPSSVTTWPTSGVWSPRRCITTGDSLVWS
jgi:hypothetical protein